MLNGIAYDAKTGLFYLTGKRWRAIFVGRFRDAQAVRRRRIDQNSGGARPTGSGPSITRPSTKRSGTVTAGLPSSVVRFPIASSPARMLGPRVLAGEAAEPGQQLVELVDGGADTALRNDGFEVELLEHVLEPDHRHLELAVEIAARREAERAGADGDHVALLDTRIGDVDAAVARLQFPETRRPRLRREVGKPAQGRGHIGVERRRR